jgi:hypothetical protein
LARRRSLARLIYQRASPGHDGIGADDGGAASFSRGQMAMAFRSCRNVKQAATKAGKEAQN